MMYRAQGIRSGYIPHPYDFATRAEVIAFIGNQTDLYRVVEVPLSEAKICPW